MKVIHSGTLDVTFGGPSMSIYLTMLGLRQQEVDAQMFMKKPEGNFKLRGYDVPVNYIEPGYIPQYFRKLYTPGYKKALLDLGDFDIYHAQGVWVYATYAFADVAKSKGKPYIITPRGMLYPQDIAKHNALFKKLSLVFRLKRDLNKAACVHVTCNEEMEVCRNLGVTSPIAVIPNPVEIKEYDLTKKDNVFRLGYLGRISPRKNVESLIYAFAQLGDEMKDSELLIIGGGDDEYEKFLKSEVERLRLTNVRFTGFLSGQEKDEALASCSVLAMPSEFENLGNVVLEGLVRRIPCIATKGAPWQELETHRCGWWVDYSQEAITEAVRHAKNTTEAERVEMGNRGRELMEKSYSVEAVASKMKSLYEWVLGVGEKKDFIYLYN